MKRAMAIGLIALGGALFGTAGSASASTTLPNCDTDHFTHGLARVTIVWASSDTGCHHAIRVAHHFISQPTCVDPAQEKHNCDFPFHHNQEHWFCFNEWFPKGARHSTCEATDGRKIEIRWHRTNGI
jgi:hypothetical protein